MTMEMWFPVEGRRDWVAPIVAGSVVAIDHPGFRHKPWRIHEMTAHDDKWRIILRPDGPEFDFAQHNVPVTVTRYARIYSLPEHYAVCHKCGQIPPCSEVWSEKVSRADVERSARFEVEGICPACQEPVTHRQKSHRFPENLRVPLGPPVTFHARHRCLSSAISYDKDVATSTGREPLLSCTGFLVHHLDDHMECTNITCPGTGVAHSSYARCYALNAKCNRPECWVMGAQGA